MVKAGDHDEPGKDAKRSELDKFYQDRELTTPWDRLRMMWRADAYKNCSPELKFVYDSTMLSCVCGIVYGGFQEGNKVQRIFLEQNKYAMFQHPREAQKAMQDRLILAFMQGGWRAGSRLGLLGFTFAAVSQSLVALRGYINPLDYGAAGGVMGIIYRLPMGPKGMFGGGVAGGLLGLQGGALTWLLQWATGETITERWEREYRMRTQESDKIDEGFSKKDQNKRLYLQDSDPEDEDSVREKEDNSVYRQVIVKVRQWLEEKGFVNSTFEVGDYNESETVKSHNDFRTRT